MKISVIYDSKFGNTQKVAETIKEVVEKKYEVKVIHVTDAKIKDIENADMVIIGSPTHRGNVSEATKVLLNMIPKDSLKGKPFAVFDTSVASYGQNIFMKGFIKFFGYAAPKMANILKKRGAKIGSVQSFFVMGMKGPLKEDEIERVKNWASSIIK